MALYTAWDHLSHEMYLAKKEICIHQHKRLSGSANQLVNGPHHTGMV